jgi:Transposase DDE domain
VAVPVSGTFLTSYRWRLKTCWPTPHGRTSVGAPERKESSKLVLLLSASGSPTGHRSGSGTRVSNICQGRAWLIGEHRMSGEKKYYLANLPAKTDLRTLAATIKARWICEQAHQQMKEELGLDHFEGRSWQGLHRHALMTMLAYAFLQHRRLAATARKKKNQRRPPQPTLPAVRHAILELFARLPPQRCPHCQKWICSEQRRE